MLYALDMDIASLYLWGDQRARTWLQTQPITQIAVPIVVVQELLSGWLPQLTRAQPPDRYITPYAQLHAAVDFLSQFVILNFDTAVAVEYARLRSTYRRIGTNDLRIAAIALVNNAVVVTRNVRDFGQVTGLVVEDWST